jgi:hypothetical protein
MNNSILTYLFRIITRTKKVIAVSHDIIIDPSTIESKKTHEGYHIAKFGESFADTGNFDPIVVEN